MIDLDQGKMRSIFLSVATVMAATMIKKDQVGDKKTMATKVKTIHGKRMIVTEGTEKRTNSAVTRESATVIGTTTASEKLVMMKINVDGIVAHGMIPRGGLRGDIEQSVNAAMMPEKGDIGTESEKTKTLKIDNDDDDTMMMRGDPIVPKKTKVVFETKRSIRGEVSEEKTAEINEHRRSWHDSERWSSRQCKKKEDDNNHCDYRKMEY